MRSSLPGIVAIVVVLVVVGALTLAPVGGDAAHARSAKVPEKTKAHPTPAKRQGKGSAKAASDAKSATPSDAPPLPPPKGKVAVFAFTGDGATPVYKELLHILQARGLKVQTSIRPMDTAEQYRELAQTLDLIAFVDGETEVDGTQGSATIHVRNGVSGLRVASATFAGEKRKLPGDLGRALWDQLAPVLAQATLDAAGPRRHDRAPLRIEAGTPLTNQPVEESQRGASPLSKAAPP